VAKLGYRKRIEFISGDSHKTLPRFFGKGFTGVLAKTFGPKRPAGFDLITIDGDHSLLGAHQDLVDTMPHCAIGGAVVFDDIVTDGERLDPKVVAAERGADPHGWKDLLGAWRVIQGRFPGYRYFEYTKNPPGIGIAARMS
jgi:predicted O-methyltransferase YrrM